MNHCRIFFIISCIIIIIASISRMSTRQPEPIFKLSDSSFGCLGVSDKGTSITSSVSKLSHRICLPVNGGIFMYSSRHPLWYTCPQYIHSTCLLDLGSLITCWWKRAIVNAIILHGRRICEFWAGLSCGQVKLLAIVIGLHGNVCYPYNTRLTQDG